MKDAMKDTMKDNKDIVLNGALVAVALNLGAIALQLVWAFIASAIGASRLSSVQAMTIVAVIAIVTLAVTKNKYMCYNLVVVVTSLTVAWLMH